MSLKTVAPFCFLILLIACKKKEQQHISFEKISQEFKSDCNTDDCAIVALDYITFTGDKEVVGPMNRTIKNSIISFLSQDKINSPSVKEAASHFLHSYEKDKKEFPDLYPYDVEITMEVSLLNSDIISVKNKQYAYTGGAHGNATITFLNFDSVTGDKISLKSLFNDMEAFTKIAETKLREQYQIQDHEPINSTGFWFDEDRFSLPETIGFTETEVVLIYNPYEIASYADGFIEITIPKQEVEPFLN